MHPGFHGWWRARHDAHDMGQHPHCGHERHHHGRFRGGPFEEGGRWAGPQFDEGGVFGVRRPLRFLAYKLGLNEQQVSVLAAVLDELKTERAQAAVDQRRRITALAEAFEGTTIDDQRLANIGVEQEKSDARIRDAVAAALKKIHAALDDEQRKQLAYMLRTGTLSI